MARIILTDWVTYVYLTVAVIFGASALWRRTRTGADNGVDRPERSEFPELLHVGSPADIATPRDQRLRVVSVLCSVVLFAAAGCSGESPRVPTYPVEGQVLLDGKPPIGAQVVFHSTGNHGAGTLRPTGQVDQTGKFILTTFAASDGAPEGEFDVTVEWWESKNDQPAVNRLPSRYRQPNRSGLHAKITAGGPNSLPTFKLAR
jgi:hypothetical protein